MKQKYHFEMRGSLIIESEDIEDAKLKAEMSDVNEWDWEPIECEEDE